MRLGVSVRAFARSRAGCARGSVCRLLLTDKTAVITKFQLSCSPESPGLALGLEQDEDVALADGALHVADEGAADGADELDLNLCNSSSGACSTLCEHGGGDTYRFCRSLPRR